MLAIALQYLNGWAMAAADGAKKEVAEWPPHPDRVFMALAAAYFETDDGDKDEERAALEWLESLPPPAIAASEAHERRIVTHFVPVNDGALAGRKTIAALAAATAPEHKALKAAGLDRLPEHRSRQPRTFPVAIPHRPIVHLIWPDGQAAESHHRGLAALCRKVTHVGHSASLVAMWLADEPPEPDWVPLEGFAAFRMRVPEPRRLAYLAARGSRASAIRHADLTAQITQLQKQTKSAKGPAKKSLKAELAAMEQLMTDDFPEDDPEPALDPKLFRPEPGLWQGYGKAASRIAPQLAPGHPGSCFDPNLVVLRLLGRRLGLPSTLKLTEVLRHTIMSHCPEQPPPEWLCGHGPDGKASGQPHLAFVPLPFIGHDHADGRIMGAALVLPRHIDPAHAGRCLGPILREDNGEPRRLRLFDAAWLDCEAELETRWPPPQHSLQKDPWIGPARRWASVTPTVLDRHHEGRDKWERAAESVRLSCTRIGLPAPTEVVLHPDSLFRGAPRSSTFPRLTRKRDQGRMHHTHALLEFDREVAGPVLVGAGRFRGYGLFRPFEPGGGQGGQGGQGDRHGDRGRGHLEQGDGNGDQGGGHGES